MFFLTCVAPTNGPRRRGKAQGLAAKNFKEMNNNQKAKVEFKKGLLKPVGPWAASFTSKVGEVARMYAPLGVTRDWRKVDPGYKESLHQALQVIYVW